MQHRFLFLGLFMANLAHAMPFPLLDPAQDPSSKSSSSVFSKKSSQEEDIHPSHPSKENQEILWSYLAEEVAPLFQDSSFRKTLIEFKKNPRAWGNLIYGGIVGGLAADAWSAIFGTNSAVGVFLTPNSINENGYGDSGPVTYPALLFFLLPNILNNQSFAAHLGVKSEVAKACEQDPTRIHQLFTWGNRLLITPTMLYLSFSAFYDVTWGYELEDGSVNAGYLTPLFATAFILSEGAQGYLGFKETLPGIEAAWEKFFHEKDETRQLAEETREKLQERFAATYRKIQRAPPEELLRFAASLKGFNQEAQTAEEKQQAFFQTLLHFYHYATVNSETDETYAIQQKPFSLVATERFFQGVGALVTIPAILANYFSINAQRGESLGLEEFEINFQDSKMREARPWAGALPLGFLAGINGFASGGEVGYRLWNRWTGHDPNLYQENLQVWEQTYPGIRAFADTAAYLISSFLIFPVAGLATQQLHFVGTPIEFQRAFMFWSIFHWGLTTTLAYAEACQEIVSKVGGWVGGDPIGRVREDMLRFVVSTQETFYKLQPSRLVYLAESLEKASEAPPQHTSETNIDDGELLETHQSTKEGQRSFGQSDLREPLLKSSEDFYNLAEPASNQMNYRAPKSSLLGRARQWLFGLDVPSPLRGYLDTIQGRPMDSMV